MGKYYYTVYGLILCSELELPELKVASATKSDVSIVFGEVPDHLPKIKGTGVLYEACENDFLFKFEGIGKFRVQNGNQITIQPNVKAHSEEIGLFLLGPNIGALLHQRGILTINGSAISDDNHTIILTGNSGVGKSSLAAGLLQLGYSVISDDISVINQKDKINFVVQNGVPYLKLWRDILIHLNNNEDLNRIRPHLEKYKKPISLSENINENRLSKIIVLSSSNIPEFQYSKLFGMQKFHALRDNTFHIQYVEKLNKTEGHFRNLSRLVNAVSMFHAERPHSPLKVIEFANYIEKNILLE